MPRRLPLAALVLAVGILHPAGLPHASAAPLTPGEHARQELLTEAQVFTADPVDCTIQEISATATSEDIKCEDAHEGAPISEDQGGGGGQYGAGGTFVGLHAVGKDGLGPLDPGCYNWVQQMRYRNIFQRDLFAWTVDIDWCFNGRDQITYVNYTCYPTVSHFLWDFEQTLVEKTAGGSGQSSFTVTCTGKFHISWTGTRAITRTPTIKVSVTGSGSYASSRTG